MTRARENYSAEEIKFAVYKKKTEIKIKKKENGFFERALNPHTLLWFFRRVRPKPPKKSESRDRRIFAGKRLVACVRIGPGKHERVESAVEIEARKSQQHAARTNVVGDDDSDGAPRTSPASSAE